MSNVDGCHGRCPSIKFNRHNREANAMLSNEGAANPDAKSYPVVENRTERYWVITCYDECFNIMYHRKDDDYFVYDIDNSSKYSEREYKEMVKIAQRLYDDRMEELMETMTEKKAKNDYFVTSLQITRIEDTRQIRRVKEDWEGNENE